MLGKTSCILLSALLSFQIYAASDPLTELRSARKAIKQNPNVAETYLNNKHPEIRRFAIYSIAKQKGTKAIPVLCNAMNDKDDMVRLTAVMALSSLSAAPAAAKQLKLSANKDSNLRIRQIAGKKSWPFVRKTTLLRQDATWDHDVTIVHQFDIPENGWKLKPDPDNIGYLQNWFATKFDESNWLTVKIGPWENQGLLDYDGFGWYRIKFTMPKAMDSNAVEVHFEGVDDSAWVWMNGIYLGDHDEGLDGWNKPFALDCRKEIRWGEENLLVVCVQDRVNAGGIYKKIRIEVLK